MRRHQVSALGPFFVALLFLAALYSSKPATFFSDSTVHFWALVALVSGLFTIGEELLDGASLARSTEPLLRAVVAILVLAGIVWFMISQPIQIFPASTGPTHSGAHFLPNIFR